MTAVTGGPSSSLVGRDLGSYQVVRELGEGGMGVVFEAEHRWLGRTVAIKTIRPDAVSDSSFSQRFMIEARAICALDHPGIVRLYDFAFEGDTPYIVMEHVRGKTLQEVIEGGRRLDPSYVVELLRPIAEALDHAHAHGIVHRDVKPGNLLLAYDGRTMIMDFGLAHLAGYTMATDPDSVLGTPDYIAPEQVAGEEVDGRADTYSLASVVFEAVTGRPPFTGGSWIDIASRRLREAPPFASDIVPEIPLEFSRRLARALERDPKKRPSTAVEFFDSLAEALVPVEEQVLETQPLLPAVAAPVRRRWWQFAFAAAGGAFAYATIATAGWLAYGDGQYAQMLARVTSSLLHR